MLVVLLITVLAIARITRFIAVDKLSDPARSRIIDKLGADHLVVYGIHCPMCVGIWIAAAVTPFAWFLTDAPDVLGVTSWFGLPATTLAVAYLASLIIGKEN